MIEMFQLPETREALLERLTRATGAHGQVMGGSARPSERVDAQAAWQALRPAEEKDFVIYVHVPFCVSRCSFCGFYRNRTDDAALEAYTQALLTEIDRVADEGHFTQTSVSVVYFGGGTPTALTADQLRRVITKLYTRFTIRDDVEFTIEGRLYAFDDDRVRACLESGVTRFSFGVQSFETKLRQSLGRRLTREETLFRLEKIKALCGDRIALVADLIYGLPGQTQEDWMTLNVQTAHESVLDGVDLYSLKIVPGMPLAERIKREGNWTEEERIARHAAGSDFLAAHGWTQLSTTHWGREVNGKRLECNRYNTLAKISENMIPFGCGAGGFVNGWAIMQEGDLERYHAAVAEGKKPIGSILQMPGFRADQVRFTAMTDLGYFRPSLVPERDFSPILENWTRAGIWTPDGTGAYRFTRTGEYYQPKLNSLLVGYYLAAAQGKGAS